MKLCPVHRASCDERAGRAFVLSHSKRKERVLNGARTNRAIMTCEVVLPGHLPRGYSLLPIGRSANSCLLSVRDVHLFFAPPFKLPEGAQWDSQGRQPWERTQENRVQPRRGERRTIRCAPPPQALS